MSNLQDQLAALADLRLGVEMDAAHMDDGALKLEALDAAITALGEHSGTKPTEPLAVQNRHFRLALERIAEQGASYGPDGTRNTWVHWADLAQQALDSVPNRPAGELASQEESNAR